MPCWFQALPHLASANKKAMRVKRNKRGDPLPMCGCAIAYAWLEQAVAGDDAASTIHTD